MALYINLVKLKHYDFINLGQEGIKLMTLCLLAGLLSCCCLDVHKEMRR